MVKTRNGGVRKTKPTELTVVGEKKKKSKVVARKTKRKMKAKSKTRAKVSFSATPAVVTIGSEPAGEPGCRRIKRRTPPVNPPNPNKLVEESVKSDKQSEEGEDSDDQYPKLTKEREAEVLNAALESNDDVLSEFEREEAARKSTLDPIPEEMGETEATTESEKADEAEEQE
mmetsp:Transcript_20771/g.22231  ORF Transcript_20771/g.22231 Transcript_20771/m.22231 type:complete len:172 (-) Transcript_20771:661-1176(-)